MKADSAAESWMTAGAVLELLHEETGLLFTAEDLLFFFDHDYCSAYLDCSFAPGHMSQYQHLASRMKGAGYCRLLNAQTITPRQEKSLLVVAGPAVVHGKAWVYLPERNSPQREEGIWRFDFGVQTRPLQFDHAEIHDLCRRIEQAGLPSSMLRSKSDEGANGVSDSKLHDLQPAKHQ